MRCRSRLLGVFAIGTMAVHGCSSSGNPPTSSDSGDEGTTIPEGGGDTGSGIDSGVPQTCDAALPVDAGGACTQCTAMLCAAELALCQADCACNPIEACLQTVDLNYTACPGAIGAISSGEPALMNLAGCTATKCHPQCFPSDEGGG